MTGVVSLSEWRARRGRDRLRGAAERRPLLGHPEGAPPGPLETDEGRWVDRLERAVGRLEPLLARAARPDGRLDRALETEVLALVGAVSAGLLESAAARADRLVARLSALARAE
jgi:hypothetical protein